MLPSKLRLYNSIILASLIRSNLYSIVPGDHGSQFPAKHTQVRSKCDLCTHLSQSIQPGVESQRGFQKELIEQLMNGTVLIKYLHGS